MPVRIAIIGPGAVGGTLAAHLARNPELEVVLCARRPLIDLQVITPAGDTLAPRTPVITEPGQATPVDWVLVTTKAYDVAGAAKWFPTLVGPATRIAILQNGVEHIDRFRPYADPEKLLPVMVDLPAERPHPNRITQRGTGRMRVPASSAGIAFVELFAATGMDVATTPDFLTAIWSKLALNATGAVSALTLQPAGVVHQPAIAKLMHAMVLEVVAVARAAGAKLEDSLADEIIAGQLKAPRDAINSLHADRLAGRIMEIDARNGAVVRAGLRHGIPTPLNAMAVTLLSAQQPLSTPKP
jgi:2-dehydropantoate 2-reductase